LNIQRNVVKSANRPKTVLCNACVSNKERLFDPSFVVKRPLIIKGKIIAKKGQIINPLKFLPLTSTLLFINGDSSSEVNWALNQKGNTKIILTKGSPFILQEKFNTNIYFDQNGVFKKRFSIECTPTIVMQKENLISISHISLDKTGGD
jgi:conjugal transfer pilus assembly protein TraW